MSASSVADESDIELFIRICATPDVTAEMWSSYGEAFGEAFGRSLDCQQMRHRFLTSVAGCSYHAFLMRDDDTVVGACSVIPYDYDCRGERERWGLVMGAFIRRAYRSDPFHLKVMYERLADFCHAAGVRKVISLPNANAYRYWKSVTRWRDVGDLHYYVLPIAIGTLVGLGQPWRHIADACGRPLALAWLAIARLAAALWNPISRKPTVRLHRHQNFQNHRYPVSAGYCMLETHTMSAVYRVASETHGAIAYVMECCRADGRCDARTLASVAAHIAGDRHIAAIVYVGVLGFPQVVLPQLPKRVVPQRMPLMIGDLSLAEDDPLHDLLSLHHWEFGLVNYDVR